jgi:hypothetical protein
MNQCPAGFSGVERLAGHPVVLVVSMGRSGRTGAFPGNSQGSKCKRTQGSSRFPPRGAAPQPPPPNPVRAVPGGIGGRAAAVRGRLSSAPS